MIFNRKCSISSIFLKSKLTILLLKITNSNESGLKLQVFLTDFWFTFHLVLFLFLFCNSARNRLQHFDLTRFQSDSDDGCPSLYIINPFFDMCPVEGFSNELKLFFQEINPIFANFKAINNKSTSTSILLRTLCFFFGFFLCFYFFFSFSFFFSKAF